MIQVEGIFSCGGSDISAPIIGKDFNWSGGDGTYQVLDDGDGNWRIKFLSSGTFTPLKNMVIDAFLVAAGGGGAYRSGYAYYYGGGGGYTITVLSIVLVANTEYSIVVGAGGTGVTSDYANTKATSGGISSAFGSSINGGFGASTSKAGDGGSGGGGSVSSSGQAGTGGTDGSNGTGNKNNGTGQGTTTREFGESTGTLYASGGDGIKGTINADSNTGDGGDAAMAGGSGIVIIRKHKEGAA